MRKTFLMALCLLVIGLFLIGCAPADDSEDAALAGEAVGTSSCKLVEFKSEADTGNKVCRKVGKSCLFSFGSIYYRTHASTDGSCTGDVLWMVPEPSTAGMMYQPQECDQIIKGAEMFQIPALDADVTGMPGVTDNGAYCFKGEKGAFEGHDVLVSKEKTKQQALCC